MTHAEEQMKQISKRLEHWANKAKQDYPQQLEESLKRAVDKLDPQAFSRASEELVATVTGNRKTARHARKRIEKSLMDVQRKYGTEPSKGHAVFLWVGAGVLIAAVCAAVMWRATRTVEHSPTTSLGAGTGTHTDPRGVDPDLGP